MASSGLNALQLIRLVPMASVFRAYISALHGKSNLDLHSTSA